MSNAQTLAELKAEVEAEENQSAAAVVEEVEESEPEEIETETEEVESEDEAESEEVDDKPEWAKAPDTKNFVPARVHADLRKSLRATQSDADSFRAENEQLKTRLAALEGGQVARQPSSLEIPTLENCGFDDNLLAKRTAEYSEALVEQRFRKQAAEAQQEQHKAQINSQVEKHYERAGVLIDQKSVTEDNFRSADLLVRKAIAESIKGDADYITDYIIANLGEGSEKVFYHLGVNPKALAELKTAFQSDPTGIRAASYLGELKGKFNSAQPTKLSNAPKPDKALKSGALLADGSRKAFDKAVKSDDPIAIMHAKRAARAKGIDTSQW